MRKFLLALLFGLGMLMLNACGGGGPLEEVPETPVNPGPIDPDPTDPDPTDPDPIDPDPAPAKAQRTVLVYWVADNGSADLSRFAIDDFEEMLAGIREVDTSVNNLLFYSEIEDDVPHLIRIVNQNGVAVADTVCTYPEQNPLEIAVMSEVLEKVQTDYPAEGYGLVFASHGEGWLEANRPANRWIGDYRGTRMNVSDLKEALDVMPRLDFLFFDACFMQSVEVVYELRECADYFIGSATEIPGPGAPYDQTVPAMFADDVAFKIAESYFEPYNKLYNGGEGLTDDNWTAGVSVSVVVADALEELAEETRWVIINYVSNKEEVDLTGIMCYDKRGTRYYHDLDGFIFDLLLDTDEYRRWERRFVAAVPYYKTTVKNYSMSGNMFSMLGSAGLSTYLPRAGYSNQNNYYRTLEWYRAAGWDETGW